MPMGGYHPPRQEIGVLMADGPNVWINQRPASNGEKVYEHDQIATGAASRANILLNGGGYVQLDENTDPIFEMSFQNGKCIVRIHIGYGNIHIDTGGSGKCTVATFLGNLSVVAQSEFNLEVAGELARLTTFEGNVSINHPFQLPVPPSHQIVLAYRDLHAPVREQRVLTPGQMREVSQWWSRFPVVPAESGWCCGRGTVIAGAAQDCQARGEAYYPSQREAISRCARVPPYPPPPPVLPDRGYCCVDGNMNPSDGQSCAGRGGFFSRSQSEAMARCRPPPPPSPGYCCVDGNIDPGDGQSCARRGGFFSPNRDEVLARCRPSLPPEGWCCENGNWSRASAQTCAARGGSYTQAAKPDRPCLKIITIPPIQKPSIVPTPQSQPPIKKVVPLPPLQIPLQPSTPVIK